MFTRPDDIPDNVEELAALRDNAITAFRDAYDEDSTPSEDELNYLSSIVDFIDEIDETIREKGAADERDTTARQLADKINTAAARRDTSASDGDDPDGDDEPTGEDTDAQTQPDPEDTPAPEPEHEEPVVDTVHAAAKRTSFAKAATGHTPPDVPTPTRGWRLTTSAKNFETGIVDSLRVAEEFQALAHGRSARVLSAHGRSETTLAYLDRDMPAEFSIGDQADAIRVLDAVTDETRLKGGSLVAAGGWCAPSEIIYDFLPVDTPADLLSLPEVSIRRGGVKFPKEPDFAAVYEAIGFHQTETQAQAKTEKTCYEIPCGEFEELRLDVQGVCITSGVLQDKAWPELTKKYIDEALRLHAHKINAWRIGKIVDGSTAVSGITGTFGTAGAVLSTLELQVADMRAKHRIPSTRAVEGIAPLWLINVLRADLAYRDEVLPQQVTDEQVKQHFRTLGANLQFVADWQTTVIGGATAPKAWPETVDVILYPAGTWYTAIEPVLSLGVTYDAALLKTNQAIQLFTEDGVAVGKRGPESRKITIPISVNGEVGARHAAPAA